MFNTDIILNPTSFGGANVNKTYSLVLPLGSDTSIRRVSATASTLPETLKIAHQQQTVSSGGASKLTYYQHLIRLDQAFNDPIYGQGNLSAWLVMRDPIGTSVITSQHRLDLIGRLLAFEQTAGYLDKILNNEP